jgi:hypothetical protein
MDSPCPYDPYNVLIVDLSIQEQKHLSLSDADFSRLAAIVKVLKNTSFYHTSKLADADMALMMKILKSWPSHMMFPGTSLLQKNSGGPALTLLPIAVTWLLLE